MDAHRDALRIHHGEHRLQAMVRLADEPGLRRIEVDDAGGAAVNAHLLLDRAAGDAIARTQGAIGIDEDLSAPKRLIALRALGRIGQARQHEIDDVGGEVMLARRDEDLGAAEGICAIARWSAWV